MAREGYEMIRYADDAVILCKTQHQAECALELLASWSQDQELVLHPTKTRLVNMNEPGGFDFLGYRFEVSKRYPKKINRWPRSKSLKKLYQSIKPLTKRCNGHGMETIIERINPILKGWYAYFKNSKPNTFDAIDSWVRGRLRSILRKRRKGKGRGRGADHYRWPNSCFHGLKLFSAKKAYRLEFRSSKR